MHPSSLLFLKNRNKRDPTSPPSPPTHSPIGGPGWAKTGLTKLGSRPQSMDTPTWQWVTLHSCFSFVETNKNEAKHTERESRITGKDT
ncbi:hypothetical protein ILYODFUR_001338 [Ilyodon furcidens]|uniref:Uncharacterized protein n=1 Tax=Ilyodon furcidens TaxID=33524 RepID=A0ABV0VA53_9TELE